MYGKPVFKDEWQVGISDWQENDLHYTWLRKWEEFQVTQFKEWLTHGSSAERQADF